MKGRSTHAFGSRVLNPQRLQFVLALQIPNAIFPALVWNSGLHQSMSVIAFLDRSQAVGMVGT